MKKTETLVKSLKKYNEAYRSGKPLVSDHEYDSLFEKLRQLDPDNSFLQFVEPEKFNGFVTIRNCPIIIAFFNVNEPSVVIGNSVF